MASLIRFFSPQRAIPPPPKAEQGPREAKANVNRNGRDKDMNNKKRKEEKAHYYYAKKRRT